ncbi:MAG TPA: DNA polymerase/3'-5' exonuclease PolX [Bacteroides sp.]|nr:DNA polymerase/3'-5' exonuclease PolX [Bacteroides sp.]
MAPGFCGKAFKFVTGSELLIDGGYTSKLSPFQCVMVHNKEIASILGELADLLDIKGEDQFRVRSYRKASRVVAGMSESLSRLGDDREKLKELPGIGESMAKKIMEITETGKLRQLEDLREEIPRSLLDVLRLEQVGPQRTKMLHDALNITSIDDLERVAREGEIEKLKGFGEKTSAKILKGIEEFKKEDKPDRFLLAEVDELISSLLDHLEKKVDQMTIAGSYRRRKETVGDIDILVTAEDPGQMMEHFVSFEEIREVLSKGESRSSVVLNSGLQVDLRIVKKQSWGSALLYFTGSKAHSIALRKIAREKDYKLNEYGIFQGKKRLASRTEKAMYEKLELRYIEPELREDRGEFEAARGNRLPRLITLEDIRGDLHTHTSDTDGRYSLEEMVEAARKKGYEYVAISDHSKRVAMADGLDDKRLAAQVEKINKLNRDMKEFRILKSIEVDILEDGSLDLSDDILKELDLVVCSVHYHRNLSRKKQTSRILRAMENPYFNILAHPTGRIIQERRAYEIDMEKIMKEAANRGCFLEINAAPDRLDLNDEHIRMAGELGLRLSISTDAHTLDHLNNMRYGVDQARRGWLEKEDVISTRPWSALKKLLQRK